MKTDLQLLGLLFVCLLAFAIYFRRRGQLRLADPALLFLGVFLVGTAFKLLYFVFVRAKRYPSSLHVPVDPVIMGKPESFLVPGMLFITLSVICYCLGLSHPRALALRAHRAPLDPVRLARISLIACAVTFSGMLAFLWSLDALAAGDLFSKRFNDLSGGAAARFFNLHYWSFKLLSSIKYAFYLLLICALSTSSKQPKTKYLALSATLALTLATGAIVGNRAHALLLLFDLLLLATLAPHRRRLFLLLSLFAAALGITLASWTNIARSSRPADPAEREAYARRVIATQTTAAEEARRRGGYESISGERLRRSLWFANIVGPDVANRLDRHARGRYLLDLFKTAHIVDDVPGRMAFLRGESLYGWLFVLIPKSVWSAKPRFADLPAELAATVFLEPFNNVPPGLVGEAWLNFGWYGLVVVYIVGAATGLLFNSFQASTADPVLQTLYAMCLTRVTIIMFNSSFGDGLLKIAIDTLPVLFLVHLLADRSPGALAAPTRDN